MDSDNVMTAVHEYTITNEIRIFILDITFNKLKCLQNNVRLINQYHTPKENMMKQGDMNIHSINDRWVNT